jgi:hypothetical protein
MDPQSCFYAYLGAVQDGELDLAADAAEQYAEWIAKGGFPAERCGAEVLRLDAEQDRFLIDDDGVERWLDCFLVSRESLSFHSNEGR